MPNTDKYATAWQKYLPLIKLIMRRSAKEQQLLPLSKFDFIKAGAATKGSYGFKIAFVKGSPDNTVNHQLAKDFVAALMRDAIIKDMLVSDDYYITMNTKFELSICNRSAQLVKEVEQ